MYRNADQRKERQSRTVQLTVRTFILGAVTAAAQLFASPQTGPDRTTKHCELHVWGARQLFAHGRYVAPFVKVGSSDADKARPLSNINVLDPSLRLSRVTDSTFEGFFGPGVGVTVVRHAELLDPRIAMKAGSPLTSSHSGCYGDLVLANLVDIEYRGQSASGLLPQVVGSVLGAPAGMNMQFSFRRFESGGRLVFTKRDGVNGKLSIPRSQWSFNEGAAIAAIDESIADGIRTFAVKHLQSGAL